MMAPCSPAELKAMARGSRPAGTSSGTSACCAGIWKARTAPSTTDSASSNVRCDRPSKGAAASTSATSPCAATHSATMRARWWRSTTWPATSTSASAGRNCSSPTSPRSQAEPVRSYICQPMATSIIWLALTPASRAHHRRMKSRQSRSSRVDMAAIIACAAGRNSRT